jgi:hypothetical protein
MSLAMYAAPFDNDMMEVNDTPIHRKRNQNQKTQKRYPKDVGESLNNSERVNSILKTIHNLPEFDDLTNFNPPPPPISAGVEQTISRDNAEPQSNSFPSNSEPASPYSTSPMSNNGENDYSQVYSALSNITNMQNNGNYLTNLIQNNRNIAGKEGFKGQNSGDRFMPNYQAMYQGVANEAANVNAPLDKYDLLMKKLNYMITLLEQQQDEKTGNVAEEVILYSFLGIFIIFIVDSFARVGKYVR